MGLQLKLSEEIFTHYAAKIGFPLNEGMTSLFFFGRDSVKSIKNQVQNGAAATIKGVISYANEYITVEGSTSANCIELDDKIEVGDYTLMVVFRAEELKREIIGDFQNDSKGVTIFAEKVFASDGTNYANQNFDNSGVTDFQMITLSVSGTTASIYKDGILFFQYTIHAGAGSGRNILVGGAYVGNADLEKSTDIAMVAKLNRAIVMSEVTEVYNYMKNKFNVL